MTHPTNTDLADALRQIAFTMPLGSALVLRLAADRLGQPVADVGGWIAWDASAPNAHEGPDVPPRTELQVEIDGMVMDGTAEYWAYGVSCNNWDVKGLANSRHVITRYRIAR